MNDAKEEVRARLNIEDVIGEYVQLKRAGRNLKGLSPFTDERTPSFMVSPEKQIWHDFSSGKGGDIFTFVMLVEGMDFRQALEHLARKAGVDLSLFSGGDGRTAKRRARAREALKLAANFYQQNLVKNPAALEYAVKKRRLNRQTIGDFVIGYAPDQGDALTKALEKRGFSRRELADAGLVNRFGGDLFRGRMMVALSDGSGEVVGFTGRIIRDDPRAPKYLNTPQTLLFDKSRHIFGLYQAKEAIRKSDAAVIVEGNLDVVSSHQAGIKNVVATAGTAMTLQHLKALSRLAGRIRVAFDGDRAGVSATERAINLAQEIGVELEVVSLPDGVKDPDELIQKDAALWQAVVERAQPAVDWVIARHAEMEDLATAEGKRRFSTTALRIVRGLKDPVEQEHYLAVISKETGASLAALRAKLGAERSTPPAQLKKPKIEKATPSKPRDELANIIVGLALSQPSTRRWVGALEAASLDEPARAVVTALQAEPLLDIEKLPRPLQKFEQYVKIVQLKSERRYMDWEPEALDSEMARLVKQLIRKHRDTKKQQLLEDLREAEELSDEARARILRQQLNALIKENA
ncbi:DNA primase [Candidatus Saccharibacteria bacterium oral taxon 488]|jgi:DNA primase|nr:DNA primase [Candidatus Saccharibacteria bacterium oral taxon 488]QLF51524.1 DNA primase [Candidatus Saccharibacteria bacterium oral taxon 488]